MRPAHDAESVSSPTSPLITSLGINADEPGESDGARNRTDSVKGNRLEVKANICWIGFADSEGIEYDSVGARPVGGSHLKHAMKTLYFFTGTG